MKTRIIIFSVFFLAACTSENYAPVMDASPISTQMPSEYVVKKGETLYAIAWRYDMDYRTLAEANHLASPYKVQTGQVIYLKGGAVQPAVTTVPQPVEFKPEPVPTVQPMAEQQPTASKSSVKTLPQVTKTSSSTSKPQVSEPKNPAPVVLTNGKIHWRWPAKGRIVARYSPAAGQKGVDIAGTLGEPVYAAAAGKVAYSGNGLRGYGNLIIIKHSDEFLSAYAHNQKLLVHEGQSIKEGQKIATMGNTESKRVMLHFEIREAGKSVNPLIYVKP